MTRRPNSFGTFWLAGQQLGADSDPPRVRPAELVHRGHDDEGTPSWGGTNDYANDYRCGEL
jgi:hypothetical protein